MHRLLLLPLIAFLFCSCSSVGVYSLRPQGVAVRQAPSRIWVQPFVTPMSALRLGERSPAEMQTLRAEIVRSLARETASQLRTHAANSSVLSSSSQLQPGSWLIRGQINLVDQGNRAKRATIGLGVGRTEMRNTVIVEQVTTKGLVPLLRFNTTGSSGLEPGAAFAVATGGVGTAASAAATAGSLVMRSLPGVNTDIDRTSYEIAAVLSLYLQSNGLLDSSRVAILPNMKGQLPSTLNLSRAIPGPLRPQN